MLSVFRASSHSILTAILKIGTTVWMGQRREVSCPRIHSRLELVFKPRSSSSLISGGTKGFFPWKQGERGGNSKEKADADFYPTQTRKSMYIARLPAHLPPRPWPEAGKWCARARPPVRPRPPWGLPSLLLALGLARYVPSQRLLPGQGLPVRGVRFRVVARLGANRAAAQLASGGERQGHEGEPGERQLSRPGGAPVPEDSESAELGQGPGGAGEPSHPLRNVSQGRPGP